MTTETMSQPTYSGRFISLRVKMLVLFSLLFAAGFAAAFYWFYNFATNQALARIEEDLRDTLDGAIAGINGDDFVELAQAEPGESGFPEDNPLYDAHQRWVAQIVRIEPRAIPYTFVPTWVRRDFQRGAGDWSDATGNTRIPPGENNVVLWIGDAFRVIPERQDSQTSFKDPYDSSETFLYNGLTEVTVDMVGYSDQWGRWVSAYGPIRNSSGEVIGGLGIDFEADYVDQVQQQIQDRIVIAFVIAYALLFLSVYIFSTYLSRPITALTGIAERIGEGDYKVDFTALTNDILGDEITKLASVFDFMVDKVAEREETLKKKVASLQIMIDEGKRDKQVAELTEGDFFQEVKQKAEKLRQSKALRDEQRAEPPAVEKPAESSPEEEKPTES